METCNCIHRGDAGQKRKNVVDLLLFVHGKSLHSKKYLVKLTNT